MANEQVTVKIGADTSGLSTGLNKAKADVGQFKNTVRSSVLGQGQQVASQVRSIAMGWVAIGAGIGGATYKLGEFIGNLARGEEKTRATVDLWIAKGKALAGFTADLEKIQLAELNKENAEWLRTTKERVKSEAESVQLNLDQFRLAEAQKDAARKGEESLIEFLEDRKAELGDIEKLRGNELAFVTATLEAEKLDAQIKETKIKLQARLAAEAEREAAAAEKIALATQKIADEQRKIESKAKQDRMNIHLKAIDQQIGGVRSALGSEPTAFVSSMASIGGGGNATQLGDPLLTNAQNMLSELERIRNILENQSGGVIEI
jgi:hypothetical protein